MPNKDKNIPKRRFKAFENADAWELRKLRNIFHNIENAFVGIVTPHYVSDGRFYLESNNIKDGQVNYETKVFISEEFYQRQKNKWLRAGDIVMVQSGHVGHSAVIPEELDCSAAHALIMFRKQKVKISSNFLNYQFQTKQSKKKLDLITTGNTIKHILSSEMKEFNAYFPSLPEQSAIGTFFSTLDRQITLHQRKLDKLKNVKQAYLSEMFPAEGERVPKRRFPGFTDAWELRKLGEVVYRSNITSSSKVLPRLEFEDINSGLGTLNKDIFQKVNDDRKGLEFNEGDVLFGKLRPYLKNWWYAEFNGIALGDFWNLKSDVWHSCFLYTYIQSNAFQLVANDTSGTKMPRSDWNLVAESIAKFPSLPEQKAIGTFFSTLDSQITLHQRKLEKLKNLKKALLNELFV
ncbi:TPA: restriction endonuclease subunit S [Streptococcus suis]|nr:restriction endonuclease subunit S [Streptococcus suis]